MMINGSTYINKCGNVYYLDEYARNKLSKIFACELKAVYTKWKEGSCINKWDVDKRGIRSSNESNLYIINANDIMWEMSQSEWFSIEETLNV